ncbi:diacylglycerol kinase family lipid kinase [Streptococcus sp. E17BB]|uniref:diacylglycerol kinase family lipid kinase n=1 Tax=Streptococcus sp. E17BB TaxID=3278714 RepID=UPI00359DED2E
MQKRARLIYNPTSGQELMLKAVPEILEILEGFGYETSAFQTKPEANSALEEAKRAALAGFDLIVVGGGDGTINEVVNGIAPLDKRPALAIIPAGTTNDYARALKIPRGNPVAAAKLIGKNQVLQMDIGRAYGERYFINIAAAGSLTEVTYAVPSQLKTMFGYLAYLVKGVELLPQLTMIPLRIEHDEGVFEGEVSLIFAALTNSVGGFEQLAPDAQLDNGFFTLILIKTANLLEILDLIRLVLNGGKHIEDKRVVYIKTRTITIHPTSDQRMMINLDGEYGGDAPIKLENLNKHITFFVNTDDIADEAMAASPAELERLAMAQKFSHEVDDWEKRAPKQE